MSEPSKHLFRSIQTWPEVGTHTVGSEGYHIPNLMKHEKQYSEPSGACPALDAGLVRFLGQAKKWTINWIISIKH